MMDKKIEQHSADRRDDRQTDRIKIIRRRLQSGLSPDSLEITDDSHLHVGHAGAQGGAGHYSVMIISAKFNGLNRIKRHQLVYACVNDMMPHQIHALSIETCTPEEALALENQT